MLVGKFPGWKQVVDYSPDIFLARCTAAHDGLLPSPKSMVLNVDTSDIDVLMVLKGKTTPGSSHMTSLYSPYRGERFVAVGFYYTNRNVGAYSVVEDYRIIPISQNFDANQLAGKSLDDQIQIILRDRINAVDDEMARDAAEKQRLLSGLNDTNSAAQVSTNTSR